MIVFGVNDTMKALDLGAIDKVLLFDEIEINRYVIKNPATGEEKIWFLNAK